MHNYLDTGSFCLNDGHALIRTITRHMPAEAFSNTSDAYRRITIMARQKDTIYG